MIDFKLSTKKDSYIVTLKQIILWWAKIKNERLSTLLILGLLNDTLTQKLACIFLTKMGNHWLELHVMLVSLHIKENNKVEKMI